MHIQTHTHTLARTHTYTHISVYLYTQIVLLGVCPSRRPPGIPTWGMGSSSDAADGDITLQPLPMYTVPSDNVIMTR